MGMNYFNWHGENTKFGTTYLNSFVLACLIYSKRIEMMQKMMKGVRWCCLSLTVFQKIVQTCSLKTLIFHVCWWWNCVTNCTGDKVTINHLFTFSESLARVSGNSWPLADRTGSIRLLVKVERITWSWCGSLLTLWGGAVWETVFLCCALSSKTTDLICRLYPPSAERLLFKQNIKWMVRRVGEVKAALAITIVTTAPGWGGFQTKKSFSIKDCSSCRGWPF